MTKRRRSRWFAAERAHNASGGPIPQDSVVATAMWYATKGYLYRILRYGEYEWSIRVCQGRIAPCPWWMHWIAAHVEAAPTMIPDLPKLKLAKKGA